MKQTSINLDSAEIKLVSFDVFDTVIARSCGAPETIFRMVGEKLNVPHILDMNPADFQRERGHAEKHACWRKGKAVATLAEIYAEIDCRWWLPQGVLDQIIACELETERENLFAIPGALAMVDQARRAGKRIAFVSDMYLPEDFIRAVLTELGLLATGDSLYVSSRWGASKANGGLFRIVLEQEKLVGGDVLHLGDSLHSDVQRAAEQGIRAVQITRGSLNRFETALSRAEMEIPDRVGTLAGFSRRARLAADVTGEHFIAARLGASLAGPLLTAYAEWVLRSALKRKLQRLYFLARDGEALMRLCEVLAPAVGAEGIELRYFYGSREVWSPAVLVKMDEAAAAFFASQIAFTASTWEHCVEYLGFAPAEIHHTSLPEKWAAAGQATNWKKQIFLDVAADPTLRPVLKRRLEEKASFAARYVREQGLADQVPCGLVDCGWSGTWTDILGELAVAQGGKSPLVFFLGRRQRATPPRCETLAWMFDQQAGSGLKHIPDFFHVVVEFLLTANHGRTVGFEEVEGRLRPKLAAVDWQGFNPEDWCVFRMAMLGFAELWAGQLHRRQLAAALNQEVEIPPRSHRARCHGRNDLWAKNTLHRFTATEQRAVPTRNNLQKHPGDADGETADLRAVLLELVVLFWEQPTVEEARFFSGHTIGLSPTRTNTKSLARPYNWGDARRLAVSWKLPGYPPFWWHEGAQALSGSTIRKAVGLMWGLRELLRTLRDNRAGLDAKRLARMLVGAARKLKRACGRREDRNSCRFESAQPAMEPGPLNPLTTADSLETTVS